jgi:hypothetical protein
MTLLLAVYSDTVTLQLRVATVSVWQTHVHVTATVFLRYCAVHLVELTDVSEVRTAAIIRAIKAVIISQASIDF